MSNHGLQVRWPEGSETRLSAAVHAVVGRDRALAGVVRETAQLRAAIQREDRVARERAETHRGDVEDAALVRLRGARARATEEAYERRRFAACTSMRTGNVSATVPGRTNV